MKKKLGKKAPRKDKRTLKLAKFLDFHELPPIPPTIEWSKAIGHWPIMLNDTIGDCAIAGVGHIIQSWSANESQETILTDDQIVNAYSAICGYDKVEGANDEGCIMLDVLNYWRTTGINGHKIEGFVSVNPFIKDEIKVALYLFGAVYIGLNLPLMAQDNDKWTIPPEKEGLNTPGSWGGHCVIIVDADDDHMRIVSWGKLMVMDWTFLQNYCDEAFAVFSPDDWATDGTAPNGFDIGKLREDLKHL